MLTTQNQKNVLWLDVANEGGEILKLQALQLGGEYDIDVTKQIEYRQQRAKSLIEYINSED